jgi:hypothetical protein
MFGAIPHSLHANARIGGPLSFKSFRINRLLNTLPLTLHYLNYGQSHDINHKKRDSAPRGATNEALPSSTHIETENL